MDEIQRLARLVFSTAEDADAWLHRPHPLLDGATPLELATTPQGIQRVHDLLISTQHGFAA